MLKKIFHYIFNKPLFVKYGKPLEPPTFKEKELIEDLRKTFNELSYININHYSHPERIWAQNMNRLRELVIKENIREFLRWDVILETMFVGNNIYVATELEYLRGKSDWNGRWEKAIKEVETGSPLPFNKYPLSSGNLIHHAYHVAKFEEKTGVSSAKIDLVCEFGGGYGCMCKLFHNLGFEGKYIIFDFPHFCALQKYFLKSVGITVHDFDKIQSLENGVFCVSDIETFKILLSKCNDCRNSLFIATWSMSEAPLDIRNSILPLLSQFKSFLIAYQDNFGEVNNIRYFDSLKNYYEHKVQWNQWRIKHLPGNNYLVGTRIFH